MTVEPISFGGLGQPVEGLAVPLGTQRPLIGLLHVAGHDIGSMNNPRIRALAAESCLQGANFGLFSLADLDLGAGRVRYQRLGPENWESWQGPLPDVVMNRACLQSEADRELAARLRRIAPFTTRYLPGKQTMSAVLRRTGVAPHVIPFKPVPKNDGGASISAFLAEHPRSVLKPAEAGRRGREIMFLAVDGDDIVIRELNRQWRLPAARALEALAQRTADRSWILQKYVASRTPDGRAFDVRVHVHKGGDGGWAVVRAYIRLAEAGLLVSNTSRGGYQGEILPFLARLGERGAGLVERLPRLGIETGEAVDAVFGGGNEELGVDILIDRHLHPWIVEVNAGPQSRFHEFERARFAIAYALHLVRRRGAEMPRAETA